MHEQFFFVTVFAALLIIPFTQSTPVSGVSAIPPLCEPGIIEDMPPHIKKVCLALENSNQLSSALSQYIRNEASGTLRFIKF